MAMALDSKELPADSQHFPAQDIFDKTEWLKFNVGGTMLETTRASVERLKSEFFSLLLDQDPEDVPSSSPHGSYRIDRDADALQVLLNYGRYGKIVAIPEHVTQEFLLAEIKFYRMHTEVEKAVTEFFEEKRLGPSSVRVEHVTITEMAMDKGRLHHNVYDVIRTNNICCYTKVPGSGTCYHEVGHLFDFEVPHSKFPALFRAACVQCRRKVCLADDPIIGLEGWCHKCRLCLRCQDILCEVKPDDHGGKSREDQIAQSVQSETSSEVRKTASVVFVCESQPPKRTRSPIETKFDGLNGEIDQFTGSAIAKASGLKLPKFSRLPPVARGESATKRPITRTNSTSFAGTDGKLSDLPKGFKEFLNVEQWSF